MVMTLVVSAIFPQILSNIGGMYGTSELYCLA